MHSLPVSMGVPTVGFWMTIPEGFIMEQTMQPMPPSFVPNYMSAYSDRMTFLQRVHNLLWKLATKFIGDWHIRGGYLMNMSNMSSTPDLQTPEVKLEVQKGLLTVPESTPTRTGLSQPAILISNLDLLYF